MKLFGLTGIWAYLGVALAALALVAAIIFGVNSCKKINQENNNVLINSGVTAERSAAQSEVINHVEAARNAVNNPTSNDLNVVCEKYDRNCKNGK